MCMAVLLLNDLKECNTKAFALILVFFFLFCAHLCLLSSCNCRVWPVWGVLKNALLFLQTTMDPSLVFLSVPLGNLEFRLAGVIFTAHNDERKIMQFWSSSCTSVSSSVCPLRWARQGFTGRTSAASTGAVTMAPIRWCWLGALRTKWWVSQRFSPAACLLWSVQVFLWCSGANVDVTVTVDVW